MVPLPFSVFPDGAFPQRLSRLRVQKGFGQTELALAAGLSKDLIWRWNPGCMGRAGGKLEAVAGGLGVEAECLATDLGVESSGLAVATRGGWDNGVPLVFRPYGFPPLDPEPDRPLSSLLDHAICQTSHRGRPVLGPGCGACLGQPK